LHAREQADALKIGAQGLLLNIGQLQQRQEYRAHSHAEHGRKLLSTILSPHRRFTFA